MNDFSRNSYVLGAAKGKKGKKAAKTTKAEEIPDREAIMEPLAEAGQNESTGEKTDDREEEAMEEDTNETNGTFVVTEEEEQEENNNDEKVSNLIWF